MRSPTSGRGQGDVVAERVERGAAGARDGDALLGDGPVHAGEVQERVGLAEDLAHVAGGGEVVVHAAVGDGEGLAPRLLHVHDARYVDAGVGDEVAAELEEEAAPFEAGVGLVAETISRRPSPKRSRSNSLVFSK
jgi:hypothetical protein